MWFEWALPTGPGWEPTAQVSAAPTMHGHEERTVEKSSRHLRRQIPLRAVVGQRNCHLRTERRTVGTRKSGQRAYDHDSKTSNYLTVDLWEHIKQFFIFRWWHQLCSSRTTTKTQLCLWPRPMLLSCWLWKKEPSVSFTNISARKLLTGLLEKIKDIYFKNCSLLEFQT